MAIYISNKIIVKRNRPFVAIVGEFEFEDKDLIYNCEILIDIIPHIEGRQLSFGCRNVPKFIDGTYSINTTYILEGLISGGGYQTVANILSVG